MRFIYLFFLGLNFLVLGSDANNYQPYMGINKCEIHNVDIDDFSLKKLGNNNSKISISSIVKIRNKRGKF